MYLHYIEWNEYGVKVPAVTAFAYLCGVLKRTISRVLVIIVCMGYGLTKHSLGTEWFRIGTIAVIYFFLSCAYTALRVLPDASKSSSQLHKDTSGGVVLALVCCDAYIYGLVFVSLNGIIDGLRARKQTLKLNLFLGLRRVLITAMVLAFVWMMYVITFLLGDPAHQYWEWDWSKDAFWELSYFGILVGIAYLWAPSAHSDKYAYSIELSQMDTIDEERDPLDDEYGGQVGDFEDDVVLTTKSS